MKTSHLAVLLLAGALSCHNSPTEPIPDYNISVQDYSFGPDSLNVQAGKVIQWTNFGPSAHAVASDSAKWTTMSLGAPGGGGPYGGGGGATNVQLVLHTPGRYPYHCAIHPTLMHGVLIVS
ncbi:MAG TPA: plastocyanin/azurin family copper-binding protein [Gemmatimonadales bacterium]